MKKAFEWVKGHKWGIIGALLTGLLGIIGGVFLGTNLSSSEGECEGCSCDNENDSDVILMDDESEE